jgi:hypothetical protein
MPGYWVRTESDGGGLDSVSSRRTESPGTFTVCPSPSASLRLPPQPIRPKSTTSESNGTFGDLNMRTSLGMGAET